MSDVEPSHQVENAVDQLLPSELGQFPQPKTSLDVVWMKCVATGCSGQLFVISRAKKGL